MATESFLFETYRRHLASAVEAHEDGKGADARFHYLMAAKYLLALADKGDPSFKTMRKDQAERLLEGAGTIPDILVKWTRKDVIENRDPFLEAALCEARKALKSH